MSDLKEILESFCGIDGVNGVFLVDGEGLPIEKVVKEDVNLDALEPFLFRSTLFGVDTAAKLQKDKLAQSYLEFEDSSLTSILLSNDYMLSILSTSGMNLGRIRLEIKKNKKKIESMLE